MEFIFSLSMDYLNNYDSTRLFMIYPLLKKTYELTFYHKVIIIQKFFRNSILYIRELKNVNMTDSHKISKKTLCKIYFFFYPKEHIYKWFAIKNVWKDSIFLTYFSHEDIVRQKTRTEIYNMMMKMTANDIITIGW